MQARDLMTTELVTVERGAPLSTAVERMLEARAGSAIVLSPDDAPVGIVTSSDVLRAALESGTALESVPVADVMSAPLETIEPSADVNRVLDTMAENGIKKLPVLEGLRVVGIVTTTDVARQLPEYVAVIRNLEAKGSRKPE